MKFIIFSLIGLSLSTSFALTEREQYPTCAAFSDDVAAANAKMTNTEMHERLAEAEIVFLAESHSSTDFKNAIPWVQETIKKQNFDCLLLEMPSNIATNENQEYLGVPEDHPFLKDIASASEARKPWLNYLNTLITESHKKGLKIFHTDLPEDQIDTSPGNFVNNIIRRNDHLARTISRFISSKACLKPLVQTGMGHMTSNYYINTSFKTQTIPSVPQHPAIKDRNFVSVNLSNSLFDYLVPESLNLCFGTERGYFLRTENLKQNLPYSSQLGKMQDFTFVLVPEPPAI